MGSRPASGAAALSRTTVWLGHDDGCLYVAARCEERNTAALQRSGSAYQRDLWYRDHVDVLLNPAHDHVAYCSFSVGPYEQTDAARGSYSSQCRRRMCSASRAAVMTRQGMTPNHPYLRREARVCAG